MCSVQNSCLRQTCSILVYQLQTQSDPSWCPLRLFSCFAFPGCLHRHEWEKDSTDASVYPAEKWHQIKCVNINNKRSQTSEHVISSASNNNTVTRKHNSTVIIIAVLKQLNVYKSHLQLTASKLMAAHIINDHFNNNCKDNFHHDSNAVHAVRSPAVLAA